MSGLFFRAGDFAFVDLSEFATREVKSWKVEFCATDELSARVSQIALHGAPLISWVLARFVALSESTTFPAAAVGGDSDLGGIRVRMLAVHGVAPIAKVRMEIDRGITTLTTIAANTDAAKLVAHRLTEILLEDSANIGECRFKIRAVELGARNEYGYADKVFLGTHNTYQWFRLD